MGDKVFGEQILIEGGATNTNLFRGDCQSRHLFDCIFELGLEFSELNGEHIFALKKNPSLNG